MKRYLTLVAALALTLSVSAVPALRKKRILTLTDGTTVEATFGGDEHCHFYEAADGTLYQEAENGLFCKAERTVLSKQWRESQVKMERLFEDRQQRRVKAQAAQFTGTKRGLVILANFSDLKMTYTAADYDKFFNEVGYKEHGNVGSVHDYFYDSSYGKLDVQFDVVGPVQLSKSVTYYGDNDSRGDDKHPGLMVSQAVKAAEAAGVDFSKYDWDGDKKVDQIVVIYAGYGEAQSGIATNIWPHENSLSVTGDYGDGSGALTYDGVTIDTYAVTCELRGKEGTEMDGIGTCCHEFCHCLGLPDTYDALNNVNFGMDVWDIMHYGCYNGIGKQGTCPWGLTSYERRLCGWLKATVLKEGCVVSDMKPLSREGEAYIIYNDANKNEYYLLENRQNEGFDAGGYGHGLLVLHVDYDKTAWDNNWLNIEADHQRMTIIPADNSCQSLQKGLSCVAGDPFPGLKKKTQLTNTSLPKATLYNANTDGTKLMSKPITEIKEDTENGTISFVFMGGWADAVNSVEVDDTPVFTPAYDLSGRRVTDSHHGIVIKNGKKILQ